MLPKSHLIIAIDFDGTIVEDAFPKVGKPIIFAFETLKKLQSEGHRLILWTYRTGRPLDEAVDFCKENGIEFYSVNQSYPGEVYNENISRKINADFFVDDRNIGGFIGWTEVYKKIFNAEFEVPKKKNWFASLFSKR